MKSKTDKILVIIAILVLAGLIFEGIYIYSHWPRGDELHSTEKPSDKKIDEKEPSLPESVNLEIPFVSQAPFGDWSYPFNHTCEEAAILMAHYYLEGKTAIEPARARQELLELVEYEKEHYGFHEDTNTAQTAQLIRDYYGYSVKVKYDISLEDIKRELAKGNPVIVPTAGRLLGNPYFTPPGPLYHMLLVKGYNSAEFITHDAGTVRGENFIYFYQILEKAIRDWEDQGMAVENQRSAMISISID